MFLCIETFILDYTLENLPNILCISAKKTIIVLRITIDG